MEENKEAWDDLKNILNNEYNISLHIKTYEYKPMRATNHVSSDNIQLIDAKVSKIMILLLILKMRCC